MSFEKVVDLKNGNTKRVIADNKEDLDAAVKAAKAEVETKTVDINVPLRKGHDLLSVDEALNVTAVDGTGAHNSPRDAVRDDGTVEGDPKVPVVVVTQDGETKELGKDGELKDVK